MSRISCEEFKLCIVDSGLIDLVTTGPFFTWRCSSSSRVLMSRLDRVLASEEFLAYWNTISVIVLPRTISDHHPLMMRCRDSSTTAVKPFRFQNFWTSHKDFSKVVSDSWSAFIPARDPITVCIRKLKRLKEQLRDWSKVMFSDVYIKLDNLQLELSNL